MSACSACSTAACGSLREALEVGQRLALPRRGPGMKLRMSEKSLFAVLLRSPWWISGLLALVLGLVVAALLPAEFKPAGALSGLPFLVISGVAAWRQWRLPSSARVAATAQAVSAMAWPQFAGLLEQAFQRDGYSVQRGESDGFDFRLQRQGRSTLVAARRWKSNRTGLEPLKALQAARESGGAADALLISLGELSDNARPFASAQAITVWRAPDLARLLRGLPLAAPAAR